MAGCGCGATAQGEQFEPVFADGTVGRAGSKAEATAQIRAKGGGGYSRPLK